jgi:hypothetical protein
MTADLWSIFLHTTVALVKRDLRDAGKKVQAYTNVEIAKMAKARLVEECREFLRRNE